MKNNIKFLLSNIKNSQGVHHISLNYKNSKFCVGILKFLVQKGYIRGFKLKNNNIEILLKYYKNLPVILDFIYTNNFFISYKLLCKLKESHVSLIISTPKGLMSKEDAIQNKVGGFIICKIL
jgi:small subunit ribosomal protein S8